MRERVELLNHLTEILTSLFLLHCSIYTIHAESRVEEYS